jgi:O-methyltransferase
VSAGGAPTGGRATISYAARMLQPPSHHRIRQEVASSRPSTGAPAAPGLLRKLAHKAKMATTSRERRDAARFRALTRVAQVLVPRYVMTAPEKAWFQDEEFFRAFYAFAEHDQTADRKYTLRELLRLVDDVPGDTAECGVYRGASSWFICDHFRSSGRTHHGFDSFEGLSTPAGIDGSFWTEGDLRVSEEEARRVLAPFDAKLYRGWFPDRFPEVADRTFAFVHIDVDLYQPTLDSLAFFYPRMAPGGIILLDDHGQTTCPGATRAAEEFMSGHPESIVLLTTGQAMIQKAHPSQ